MGKITDIIMERGSLRAAWDDIQDMGLSKDVVDAIGEVLAADRQMMSQRGSSGERKSIDADIQAEIHRLLKNGSLTSGKLVKALEEKFPGRKVPSRATAHRYIQLHFGEWKTEDSV